MVRIELGFGEREFADGKTFGDEGSDFVGLPLPQQVGRMSRSHACPVAYEVIEMFGQKYRVQHPEATQEETTRAGMEMALARYAECNFVWGYVLHRAQILNPRLYEQLTTPAAREQDENPDRNLDKTLLPPDFDKEMRPLSTPMGYFIPRVVIEEFGRGPDNEDRTAERIQRALEAVDRVISQNENAGPKFFGIGLAEEMAEMDANPRMVIEHTLARSILQEEGCRRTFRILLALMEHLAPTLWQEYSAMTAEQRKEAGIIDIEDVA